MLYVVLCEQLRQKYDIMLWSARVGRERLSRDYVQELVDEMDEMQETYYLSNEVKTLLFHLAETGVMTTTNPTHIQDVQEVLINSGYKHEISRLFT